MASLLAMCAASVVAIEAACKDPREPMAAAVGRAAVYVGLMVAGRWALANRKAEWSSSAKAMAALLAVTAVPFPLEWLLRTMTGRGWPFEALLLASVRNLLLGFGALSSSALFANLAAGVGTFGFLFAFSVAEDAGPLGLLFGVYLVLGCCWLTKRHWNEFDDGKPTTRRRWAPIAATTFATVLVAGIVGAFVGPKRVAAALGQWAPTSGGDRSFDRFARGGVGDDGDDTIDSTKAKSDGGQGDVYIESHQRTFYDALTETHGEPKPPKEMNRAVAVAAEKVIQEHGSARHQQTGRHFSIYRKAADRERKRAGDSAATSLLYVTGRSPVHLPIHSYLDFDGGRWSAEPNSGEFRALEAKWFRWIGIVRYSEDASLRKPTHLGSAASHVVKIGTLKGRELPLPANATAFRIGLVDRTEFFAFLQTGIIGLSDSKEVVPTGEVIETESRALREAGLDGIEFPENCGAPRARRLAEDTEDDRAMKAAVSAVARQWTSGIPRGWRQVRAVVERLRTEYVVEESHRHAGGDAVVDFLTRSKRGPNYLFATSAACLLRSLDYPCRLVGGYYADPAKYDAWTRTTPVGDDDFHFWVEVGLPGGWWAPIEPTPGFHLLPDEPTFWERVVAAAVAFAMTVKEHPLRSATAVVVVVALFLLRRGIGSAFAALVWRLSFQGDWRRRIDATVALVERRAWLAGRRRTRGQTLRHWMASFRFDNDPCRPALQQLLEWTDRHWYGGAGRTPDPDSVRDVCSRIAAEWTVARLLRPIPVSTDVKDSA
jgi:transglutaminase-like putative cysteine protease